MKKLNKKGFTLTELLAAISILGILTIMAISGMTIYLRRTRKQAEDTLAKSASNAAEQYIMESTIKFLQEDAEEENARFKIEDLLKHDETAENKLKYIVENKPSYFITFEELVEEGYLENATDPGYEKKPCDGKVLVYFEKPDYEDEDQQDVLTKYSYIVYEWCSQYSARYIYYYGHVNETKKEVDKEGKVIKKTEDVLKSMIDVTTDKKYVLERPKSKKSVESELGLE